MGKCRSISITMGKCKSISNRGMAGSMMRLLFCPKLTCVCLFTIGTILCKFFFLQYRAVLFLKKQKITNVEHPLDDFIPFEPKFTDIYMDFSPFWIRTQAFLVENFKAEGVRYAKEFISSMAKLYFYAAEIYKNNFSTTRRPKLKRTNSVAKKESGNERRELARLKMIHIVDPHLMCIPSLHIMVIVWTYAKMQIIMKALGAEREYADQVQELKPHAIAIAESVLYIKQHSINCIAAALYILYCIDPTVVPKDEALNFFDSLFKSASNICGGKREEIITYMKNLYLSFLAAKESEANWKKPLLNFLADYENTFSKGVYYE